MGSYVPAAVCRRGHVATSDATLIEFGERCSDCGARILTQCPACDHRIRGDYKTPGVISAGGSYDPPKFCDNCGAPFPWVGRQERIWELQNLLDEDEALDEATRLWVEEQLQAVIASDPTDEKEQKRLWNGIAQHAPRLWENDRTRRILDTLITETVKRGLSGDLPG